MFEIAFINLKKLNILKINSGKLDNFILNVKLHSAIILYFIRFYCKKIVKKILIPFAIFIEKFIIFIIKPFKEIVYSWAILGFVICLFITIFYPHFVHIDFMWMVWMFLFLITILIDTLRMK